MGATVTVEPEPGPEPPLVMEEVGLVKVVEI